MKYKIILPVTAQVEYLKKCIAGIPDKTKLCVLNNFVNPEVEEICKKLETERAEVHRFPWNLGAGPSFNFGLKMLDKNTRDLDFVIILSPARYFDNSVEDIVKLIEEEEAKEPQYYYNIPSPEVQTDMHSIVFMKRLYEEIGLFDENLWPYGYDDMDMQYRLGLKGHRTRVITGMPVHSQPIAQGVSSDQRLLNCHLENVNRQAEYYRRKWGGDHTKETFKTPFNDPYLTVKDWVFEITPQLKPVIL